MLKAMTDSVLTAFWIKSPFPHAPLGFGVTAWSLDDALGIIAALDFGRYLPDDLAGVQVQERITVAELDEPHVVASMGPIAVRGMWYPFVAVGVPRWATERLTGSGLHGGPERRPLGECSRPSEPGPSNTGPDR